MRRQRALAGLALVLGCTGGMNGDSTGAIAEAEGISITLAEVDAAAKERLFEDHTGGDATRLYELRSEVLDTLIEERVLARAADGLGLEPDALLEQRTTAVTDDEITAFFEEHRARLREGTQLAEVQDSIRSHLQDRKREDAVRALVDEAGVVVHLEAPRFEVAADGPSRGPANAPITIVEFSDFECPFCRRAGPVVTELLQKYPEQVRVVYRHLPLESIHSRARPAALASACAEDQGRFWEFHDAVFASDALADADLRAHAEATGLDLARYDTCLAQGTHEARIDADIAAAREVGISGTPAFLVNGVLLTGAQPIEAFERVIDRELARVAMAP
jgi:predicted DsbA family dithiol-disulfide isomerase